ncbi:MAG: c-type cytochrome [Rhodospirillaceae bacterium]
MNRFKLLIILPAALGAAALSGPPAAADMASSAVLAHTCFSCHGPGGRSAGAMPSIDGKPAKLIELNLKDFRDGKRESTVMQRIAKGFTDVEIKAISEYLAKTAK